MIQKIVMRIIIPHPQPHIGDHPRPCCNTSVIMELPSVNVVSYAVALLQISSRVAKIVHAPLLQISVCLRLPWSSLHTYFIPSKATYRGGSCASALRMIKSHCE